MRKAALSIFAILLMVGIHGTALCDDSLTVTLDPSASQAPRESTLQLHHETLRSPQGQKTSAASKGYSSSGKQTVVGWVGMVTASKVEIKRTPERKARTLFACPKETYLAVMGQRGSWYGVLMIDASTGWVEKSKVEILNYQVVSPSSPAGEWGSQIISSALKYLGVPYRWGGNSSASGLDCSGFVRAVFGTNGVYLPRVAREQALVGQPVSFQSLRAGDRLYFACKGGQVDHAGIYMGNGLFIHSSVGRHGVAVDSISKPLFSRSLVTARRS